MQKQQNKNNIETKWRNHRQILFLNYCEDKTKMFDMKYTNIIQGPYNKQLEEKNFCTHYESLSKVRNFSTE
jgi:hypothetical protein